MTDKPEVVATYSAAADHFDGLPFWHEFGRRTVRRLQLPAGARVLDLCCGTGASALPAARRRPVGIGALAWTSRRRSWSRPRPRPAPPGSIRRASRWATWTTLTFPPASFDAVLSVFGLFFLDDMARHAAARVGLAGARRPAGHHGVGRGRAGARRGDLLGGGARARIATLDQISPADRLATPGALTRSLRRRRLPRRRSMTENTGGCRSPHRAAFWPVILGTSNRGVLEALPQAAQARVRAFGRARSSSRQGATGLDMTRWWRWPGAASRPGGSIAPSCRMAASSDDTIAALVARADGGDVEARGALFSALYDDLHRLAQAHVRRSVGPLTLGATTLLHEAYLADQPERDAAAFPDRNRFLGYASRAMRGLVINYVRDRSAQKRGGDLTFVPLDDIARRRRRPLPTSWRHWAQPSTIWPRCNPDLAELVDLKFFCGFSFAEIAAMRGVSERTVQRDWAKARLLLHRGARGRLSASTGCRGLASQMAITHQTPCIRIDPQTWTQVSPLLDEALDLPSTERAAWVRSCGSRHRSRPFDGCSPTCWPTRSPRRIRVPPGPGAGRRRMARPAPRSAPTRWRRRSAAAAWGRSGGLAGAMDATRGPWR